MDHTKTIHEFLDGSLETLGEEEFFLQLSNNEEMRSELKQQLAMKDAIKSDTKAFSPSAAATLGIFSTLGFASPIAAQAAGIPLGTKVKNFFAQYKQGFVGGIMSATATVAVIFWLFNPVENIAEKSLPIKGEDYAGMEAASESLQLSVPKVVSRSVETGKPEVIVKYVYVPKESAPLTQEETIVEKNQSYRDVADVTYSHPLDKPQQPALNYDNTPSLSEKESIYQNYLIGNTDLNTGFSLEVRGSQDWLMNSSNVTPATFPKFNNMAVTAMYALTDNFQAGIDIRQENFYQEFTGYDEINKRVYNIQQQPNFTSAGIALRYTWNKDGWIPITNQLTVAGTNAGLIGRFMLGTQYSPYNNISFMLGLEYSILRYFHQDQYFASPKIGLNYGVSFKL
jgi:hypothetical protein